MYVSRLCVCTYIHVWLCCVLLEGTHHVEGKKQPLLLPLQESLHFLIKSFMCGCS